MANHLYCASDSGLGRGFTIYRDYIFPRLSAFRMAALVDRPVAGLQALGQFLADRLDLDFLVPAGSTWGGCSTPIGSRRR